MSDYYVSSVNGSNANDGSSSANAKKYLELDDGNSALLNDAGITLVSGDRIFIDSAHVERYSADVTINFGDAGYLEVVSIDWSALPTLTYEVGATFGNDADAYQIVISGTNDGEMAMYGCAFRAGSSDYVTISEGGYFEDCTFGGKGTYGYNLGGIKLRCVNCTFAVQSITTPFYFVGSEHTIVCENCTFTGTSHDYIWSAYNSSRISGHVQFVNCDFSACSSLTHLFADNYLDQAVAGVRLLAKNCKLPTGCELMDGLPAVKAPVGFVATMIGCYNGSSSTPQNWNMEEWKNTGKVIATSSTKRAGGATDGQTSFSWKIEPASQVNFGRPLLTPPMSVWTPPMSGDATVYLVSDIPLTNRDCWLEINHSDSSSPSYAEGEWVSTRETPLGSGTTLVASSGNWTNSLTYEHKISREVVTAEAGLIEAQLAVSASGATIYLDPVIHLP